MARACQLCESQRGIEEHHIRDYLIGDDGLTSESVSRSDADSIDLCTRCHADATQRLIRFEPSSTGWRFVVYDDKVCKRLKLKDGSKHALQPRNPDTDEDLGDEAFMVAAKWSQYQERVNELWRELAEDWTALQRGYEEKLGKRDGKAQFREAYRDAHIADSEMHRMRLVATTLPPEVGRTLAKGMQEALAKVRQVGLLDPDAPDDAELLADAKVLSISDFQVKYGLKAERPVCTEKCVCEKCHTPHTPKGD